MDNHFQKIFSAICSLILFSYLWVPAVNAANAEYESANASITVLLESYGSQEPVADTEVCIYKVAQLTNVEQHKFTAEDSFKEIIDSLNFSSTEKTCTYENTAALIKWVRENDIQPDGRKISDQKGKAYFYGLSCGIYLIDIPDCDKFAVNSFIAEAPLCESDKMYYNVSASPKLEPPHDSSQPAEDSSSMGEDDSSGGTDGSSISDNGGAVDNSERSADYTESANDNSDKGGKSPDTGSLVIRIALIVMLAITLGALAYSKTCFNGKKDK